MISGLKNKDLITEQQRRIRNKELVGIPLTELEQRIMEWNIPFEGIVPMKNTTKYHDRITTPPSYIKEPDEIDLDEILREMGYDMEEGGVDDEVEVDELEEWLNELDDDYEERWGYYGDEEIDVSELDEDEMRELIYQVLTDKENEQNLSEQHNIKFDGIELKGGFSGGNTNTLVYRPISSKMSDKIEDMGIPREKIIRKIISYLQKKYRGLKFDEDYSYQGYGFPIRLDMWSFN